MIQSRNRGSWNSGGRIVLILAGSFGVLALGFAGAQARLASSCVIEGTVKVTAAPRKEAKPAQDYGYSNPYGSNAYDSKPRVRQASKSLPEEIVVYLARVPGDWPAPEAHARLEQKYTQFGERALPVLVGTTVDFVNNDPIYHNVFSNSQTNPFDLGRRKRGETVSIKMRKVEVPLRVYCEIHPSMKGNILVLQNPFFAVVQPGGDFRLEGMPPGTYRLVAWHDYWEPIQRKIHVSSGKTTRVDLVLDGIQK